MNVIRRHITKITVRYIRVVFSIFYLTLLLQADNIICIVFNASKEKFHKHFNIYKSHYYEVVKNFNDVHI